MLSCAVYENEAKTGQDSIKTDYKPDGRGVADRVLVGQHFTLSTLSVSVLGHTQSPVQWVPMALSSGGKVGGGCEVDHWSLTSAEVKNNGLYIAIPPTCLLGIDLSYLVKQRFDFASSSKIWKFYNKIETNLLKYS
jgi:hypothetical protein